ncbi:hypothetical protein RSAG8_04039, partial [Rhizoctonia solani AG-8 WAC10335]
MDFPDDPLPVPVPNTYSNPSNFLIHDNHFPYPHNTLGIVVDPAPFDASSFQDTQDNWNFGACSPTFLEQLADTHVPGIETQEGTLGGLNTQFHWSTQATPLAPGADFASPITPRFSPALAHHGSETPQKQSSTHLTSSRLFVRSVSAPLHTPHHENVCTLPDSSRGRE